MRILCLAPLLALATGGCIVGSVAKTAVDVVSIPVKVVGSGVDAVTTSQSEADQKRGRQLRKSEEAAGQRQRHWAEACRKAQAKDRPCPPPPSDNYSY